MYQFTLSCKVLYCFVRPRFVCMCVCIVSVYSSVWCIVMTMRRMDDKLTHVQQENSSEE